MHIKSNTLRYLGLFLDKTACNRHFHKAKLKLQMMCRLLICYPAGLAPWISERYAELDRFPGGLLRQIYGLCRAFPTDLIYASQDVGGCSKFRLSHAHLSDTLTDFMKAVSTGTPHTSLLTDSLPLKPHC